MVDRPLRLAIVGASVRAAAQSAVRAGFEVVTADLFADRDLALRCAALPTRLEHYPDALLSWITDVEANAWFYTGALENHPDLIDQMAWAKPLWGNPGDVVRRARNHHRLRAVLDSVGLNYPEVAPDASRITQDGDWLAKTRRGSSGSGVWAVNGPADVFRAHAEEAEVERKLTQGAPAAAIFVISNNKPRLLGLTQQIVGHPLAGAAPFQYSGSLSPHSASPAIHEQLAVLGRTLHEHLELSGLVGVDLWIDGDQLDVLEVNPRYTASVEVVERATGVDALALHAAAFGWAISESPVQQQIPTACGKLILFAERTIAIDQDLSDWAIEQPDLDDIPQAGQEIQRGHPVFTLQATGETATVEALFAERVAQVCERLYAGD